MGALSALLVSLLPPPPSSPLHAVAQVRKLALHLLLDGAVVAGDVSGGHARLDELALDDLLDGGGEGVLTK